LARVGGAVRNYGISVFNRLPANLEILEPTLSKSSIAFLLIAYDYLIVMLRPRKATVALHPL
jgi:hypothetical protein